MNMNQALAASNLRNLSRDQLEIAYSTARARIDPNGSKLAVTRAALLVLRVESEIRRRDWVTFTAHDGRSMVGPEADFQPIRG